MDFKTYFIKPCLFVAYVPINVEVFGELFATWSC